MRIAPGDEWLGGGGRSLGGNGWLWVVIGGYGWLRVAMDDDGRGSHMPNLRDIKIITSRVSRRKSRMKFMHVLVARTLWKFNWMQI